MIKNIAAMAIITVMLVGCNTVKGLGKDVSSSGDKVTDVAADTQKKL
ncbi:MAG: entericidin A/B family lipoprotein [Legionellales bacterium]